MNGWVFTGLCFFVRGGIYAHIASLKILSLKLCTNMEPRTAAPPGRAGMDGLSRAVCRFEHDLLDCCLGLRIKERGVAGQESGRKLKTIPLNTVAVHLAAALPGNGGYHH